MFRPFLIALLALPLRAGSPDAFGFAAPTFQVQPPPWASGWAYLLYLLAGTGLVLLWVRWRLGRVIRLNAELEQRIRERTRTIEEQRDRIAQLVASTAEARLNLGTRVQGAPEELGTKPIGAFVLEDQEWAPLPTTHDLPAPRPQARRDLRDLDPEPGGPQPTLAVRSVSRVQICPRCSRCFSADVETCSDDGASLASPQLLPHRLQGRYELQRLLGEGGMGLVFRARDLRLGREVAVKVLKTDMTGPDGSARFRQEAHALAAIRHPGVVAIYDSGDLEEGAAYLVTELLEGHPLNELLRAQGRGSFSQVARLLRQAAAALGAAHNQGLLHRDLKPANLYLVPEPEGFQAKLLDFGLAKSLRGTSGMTQAGKVIGTPNYMSPEQVRGLNLDARSDVWSFATLAFEALTGHRLVAPANTGEAFLTITQGRFSAPSTWVPALPFTVDQAFQLGLHLEPAARPWDVEVWVNSFAKHLDNTPDSIRGWSLGAAGGGPTKDDPPTRASSEGSSGG